MSNEPFTPLHIHATREDCMGNSGAGRYLFLPGSDDRARLIARHFDQEPIIRSSPRGHHFYLGTITRDGNTIDVASVSTGMGAPSAEIIITELLKLGAKKFLRVGTCGLLQPMIMTSGDLAVATASIKDEACSRCYVPDEYPALASFEMLQAIHQASRVLHSVRVHYGVFHTKSSLYAREFETGPLLQKHHDYMTTISQAGAIASEMESSILFTLTQLTDAEVNQTYPVCLKQRILSGAICSVLGQGNDFADSQDQAVYTQNMIELAISTYLTLDRNIFSE